MALAFTEDDLLHAAGPKSFERGHEYVDCVDELEYEGTEINAIVTGTYEYDVTLAIERGELTGECSCPWSQEGNFCKHCVAVGLAVLAASALAAGDGGADGAAGPSLVARPDVDGWLESLTQQELRDELRALIRADRELRRRFELRAAQANQDAGQVLALVRRSLKLGPRHFIEYEDTQDYAVSLREAAEAIAAVIDKGAAVEAVEIVREAMGLAVTALASADDSDAVMADGTAALLPLHLRACEAAQPDPAELARHIAGHNLSDEYDFAFELDDYAELLGEAGLELIYDAYRAAYRANPKGWREKLLMERLVRADGDLDALVGLLAQDLDSRGHQHLRIAQELEAAGRAAEGLEWAESGLRDATGFIGTDLVEFVALRYAQSGRQDDLRELRRKRFEAEMTVSNYEQLREIAERCGTWALERAWAMDLLHVDLAKQGARARVGMGPVLIEILISEGRYAEAWELAQEVSSEPQRLKLAALIRAERPVEALDVYERALAPLRSQTGEEVYQRMLELLQGIRVCHLQLGTGPDFATYLAAFRAEQRRKRNLTRLLDASGLA
jgi:uncharacterized Zn finger protein